MMNDHEVCPNLLENGRRDDNLTHELHNQINANLYTDNNKENDLIQFIIKARQQGLNCLDLSKRNLSQFPSQLLEIPSLQCLYLEGNQLTELPDDLFLRLPNLKWIDLRNNKLTSIPNHGLAKHHSLQYLLLSRNRLQTLPAELGKIKTLSALNLDGNPLVHPPFQIIKQGIKAIQYYLRDKLDSDDEQQTNSSSNDNQQRTTRPHSSMYHQKSKSELGYYERSPQNLLPSHLQSCISFKRMSYSETRIRSSSLARPRAQSEMKLTQVQTKAITRKNNDSIGNVDRVEEQQQQQQLIHLKCPSINIQTINNYQQPLRSKSFIQNKTGFITQTDSEGQSVQTPFHFDPHYVQDMIKYQSRRNHSPNYTMREQEERRMHDRQIQDRIRQITDKMPKRRNETQKNPLEEHCLAKLKLREIRQLDFVKNQPRPLIETHFKPYSGNIKSRRKF